MISINNLENTYEPLSKEWNSKNESIDELQNKKYRRFGLLKWKQEVDRIYKDMQTTGSIDWSRMPDYPRYVGKLILKNEVEYAAAEVEIEALETECSKMWKKMESTLTINRDNTTFKKISQKEKRRLERETCAICYEEHNISQIVTIGSCGHSFGKSCFTNIITHSYDHYCEIKCPCCRNQTIDMIRYRK
jgi:Ring finger domain